ncbi:MAG: signal peptidase I [Bacteroidales bacterium]|nr:signal peptidase I [Bacteroidales bacterium]
MTISVTAFYVLLVISYIGFNVGLWGVFEKAGEKGWKSLVPVYRDIVWLRVLSRPKWWMILIVLPVSNVFMGYMMIWKTIRLFGKTSYIPLVFGTFFNCVYLPYLGFSKREKYVRLEDLPKFKKSSLREWGDAIIFAVCAAFLFRTFLVELYAIPTSSMESTLMVGDYLAVSKVRFGARIPETTLAIPFMHHTLLGTEKVPSYVDWFQLPYLRFPALSPVKNNDPIVFNYPDGDTVAIERQSESYYAIVREFEAMLNPNATIEEKYMVAGRYPAEMVAYIQSKYGTGTYHPGMGREAVKQEYTVKARPVDKRENYVKRCVGLPGDELQIINGQLYINGKAAQNPENMQFRYVVKEGIPKSKMKKMNINEEDIYRDYEGYNYCLNKKQINELKAIGKEVVPQFEGNEYNATIFPHDPRYKWNKDNFGPIVIPQKGVTVVLNDSTIVLYDKIIRNYELNTLEQKDGKILINGKEATEYTFQMDYYFMMGDNRHNSADSRYWGFVPEDHIVGKPVVVWLSLDKFKNWGDGKIRWRKMFRKIK